ncbi:MAG TPA: DUF4097 family beta strand repeat-containing protein [Candidatus Dormibacteraeota bacterium]|nr:DUF4097 family beta strand repeat-containing protein [Candidatus Dormibacteraeota bacterium]
MDAALVTLLAFAVPAAAHRIEKHYTVNGRPVITINSKTTGRVTVKSWKNSEVVIVGTHNSDKVEVEAEQAQNRIEVTTHILLKGAKSGDLDASYELTVPEESELEIRTDSSVIQVERVFGDLTFDTVGGDINLTRTAGHLDVHTVGGSVVCEQCSGRLTVNSVSGNIKILQPELTSVRIATTSGNIFFDGVLVPHGTYTLKNGSGAIEVRFSETDSFDLKAQTVSGSVDNQIKPLLKPDVHGLKNSTSRLVTGFFGSVNSGLAKVDLSSFSGIIRIRKRD